MRTFALITLILASVIKANTVIKHFHYHFEGGSNPMPMRFLDDVSGVVGTLQTFARTVTDRTERGFYYNAANRISNAGDVTEGFNVLAASLNGGDNKWNLDCAGALEKLNAVDGVAIDASCD